MKIFFIQRTDKVALGDCWSYVAIAESKNSALDLGPNPERRQDYVGEYGFWVGRDMWLSALKVICLGEASSEFKSRRVVVANYITECGGFEVGPMLP